MKASYFSHACLKLLHIIESSSENRMRLLMVFNKDMDLFNLKKIEYKNNII